MTISEYEWTKEVCYYCGTRVGGLHKSGCKMEVYPICGKRLIDCGHASDIDRGNAQRIPFIQRVVTCAVCGRLGPRLFKVEKEDWEKYVIPPLLHRVLCHKCYSQMKTLFPNGWKAPA